MDSLLIISDEPALAETLGSELPDVTVAHASFKTAAAMLQEKPYRLLIIDEGSPDTMPDTGKTPIIWLTRPVVLSDLLYTIRERLQRKSAPGKEELLLVGGFRLSPSERMIRSPDSDMHVALTEKETELLQCLIESESRPVARDALLKRVWGYSDDIATHTLETHIYRLRGKLRQLSESLDVVSSEEGGYRLNFIPS